MSVPDAINWLVPRGLKARINPLYLRYLGLRADRGHEPITTIRPSGLNTRHVLLVVIDALRLDCPPEIGLDWTAAVAPSTWTFPSITSIHTGLYPHEHGAVARTTTDDNEYAMPEQATDPVLPTAFERAGYDTYTGLAFLMPLLAVKGWYQRHDVFPDVRAERVLEAYREWRTDRDQTFAYLHLGDLHAPLNPPDEYVEAAGVDTTLPNLSHIQEYTDDWDGSDECQYYRSQRMALYRAAVTYVAEQLESHLPQLTDDTLVFVTGDHGEAHWEQVEVDRGMTDSRPNYGVGHGGTPLDAVARVPVAVSGPSGDIQLRGGTPSLRDIPATLLDLAFEGDRTDVPGRSWRDTIPADRIVVCEAPRYGVERKAAYHGTDKVIESQADDVVLGATVQPDAVGERFGTLSARTIEELREAFEWTDAEHRATTGRLVRGQLEALGYR